MRRLWLLAAPALLLALAAGCGAERNEVPEVGVDRDTPTRTFRFRAAGITVDVPGSSSRLVGRNPPGVFRLSLGQPFVSAFAYRRKERIPKREGEVRAAQRRLEKAVAKRDPDYELRDSTITRVAGAPAVELVGDQILSRGLLRTRSVHVYKGQAEYVFELLAPVPDFARSERDVLEPMLASLRLTGTVRQRRGKTQREPERG